MGIPKYFRTMKLCMPPETVRAKQKSIGCIPVNASFLLKMLYTIISKLLILMNSIALGLLVFNLGFNSISYSLVSDNLVEDISIDSSDSVTATELKRV